MLGSIFELAGESAAAVPDVGSVVADSLVSTPSAILNTVLGFVARLLAEVGSTDLLPSTPDV